MEVVKRHFPHLKIFARATDRAHARALKDRHVDYVIRASFVSSLEMAENMLRSLGDDEARARDSIRRFREWLVELVKEDPVISGPKSVAAQ